MLATSIVLAVLAQAAPGAQLKTELAGVVIDAGGKPVAGALVLLSSFYRIGGKDPALARTTTDAQGRFRHQAPAANPTGAFENWTLWAYRPGSSICVQAVGSVEGVPLPGSPITLMLGPTRSATVRVLDPTGRPVEGARVCRVYHPIRVPTSRDENILDSLPIPREIVNRIAARTDARGMVELADLPPEGAAFVRIETPRFGEQSVMTMPTKDGLRTARLAAVGRLSGRVKGGDPGRARGIVIQATTSFNGPHRVGFEPEGHAEVAIDDSGRFEVPALAVGKLRLTFLPRGSPMGP